MRYSKIVWIIPIIIFMYILYMNVQPFGGSVDYLIDIGSEDGGEDAKLTGPMVRCL